MSNVHKGGQTVFPYLGVRVTPKKGTMVFWFNVNESGEQDPSTRHAACPVLLGTKWGKLINFKSFKRAGI